MGRVFAASAPRLHSLRAADPDAVVVAVTCGPLPRATIGGVLPAVGELIDARDGTGVASPLPAGKVDGGGTDGTEGDGELERAEHGGLGMKLGDVKV